MALHPLDILRLTHVLTTPTPDDYDHTDMGGDGNMGITNSPRASFDPSTPASSGITQRPNVSFGDTTVKPQENAGGNIGGNDNNNFIPEHAATDRFNNLISQYPQENKPGLLRKIFGTIAGTLAGPQAEENTLHPGMDRKKADWEAQIKPANEAANLERYSNTNLRQMAFQKGELSRQLTHDEMMNETTNRRNDITEQRYEDLNKTNQDKNDIAANRVKLYQYHLENPDAKYDFNSPTVLITKNGKVTDSGIPTGHLSDMDKLMYQRGTAENVANIGAKSRETVAGERIDATTTKPESATNQQQRWLNNARQLIREQANGIGRFVHLDPNDPKGFTIEQPGKTMVTGASTGPNSDELSKINDYINNTMPPKAGGTTTVVNKTTTTVDKNAPRGFGTDKTIIKEGNNYIKTVGTARYQFDPKDRTWNLVVK